MALITNHGDGILFAEKSVTSEFYTVTACDKALIQCISACDRAPTHCNSACDRALTQCNMACNRALTQYNSACDRALTQYNTADKFIRQVVIAVIIPARKVRDLFSCNKVVGHHEVLHNYMR